MKTRNTFLLAMVFILGITAGCSDTDGTRVCESDDDCPGGWSCHTVESEHTETCKGNADAGHDADTTVEHPHLHASPSSIDFPPIDPLWGPMDRYIDVENWGSVPLQIHRVSISGSDRFSWSVSDPDRPRQEEHGSDRWPSSLAPHEYFDVRVTFSPDPPLPESAELIIESNAPSSPTIFELTANRRRPCIQVSPSEELHFWESSIDETAHKSVVIENCSADASLELDTVRISDDGGSTFALLDDNLPDTLEPGVSTSFDVAFTPTEEHDYTGELSILSDAHGSEDVRVSLKGTGSERPCPTAVAAASIEGQSSTGTSLQTSPLSTIQLDGTASSSPDRPLARYEWTILNRPQGSTVRLNPDHSTASPEIFVDVAGTYEFDLRVYDDKGTVSCGEPARVNIAAVPESDVYVELVWDRARIPGLPPTSGGDLDLHYLHSSGDWAQAPWDIYRENVSADWGVQGDTSDDPSLIREVDDGTGPEIITHSGLDRSVEYRVGAHFYDADSLGIRYATVRIYVDGTLEFESAPDYLVTAGDFRTVASIQDGGTSIIGINQLYDGFP